MSPAAVSRAWFWTAAALTAAKLWLTAGQTIYAIGPALHDDQLFATLAAHILQGDWLGPYNQFTLAKGPLFPLFLAAVFWTGLPLILAQQIIYAGACAVVTRALRPWLTAPAAQFSLYAVLLLNPMSYDAGNLGRLMRQNIYTPLGLLVVAGLAQLFHRRREPWRRQAGPAAQAGLALGGFWLTREESVWLLPAVGLLLAGMVAALGREALARRRTLVASLGVLLGAALLPGLVIASLNYRHYGWFGTVEFRAADFKDAYGALTRIKAGPELPQVPVTRQMREAAYAVSPAFARLRPHLEGPVGDHWAEKNLFPAAERQIGGGWFVWAIRDAMVAAGIASDAGAAMRHYRLIADEVNAACDRGQLPAGPRRSGFVPPLGPHDLDPLLTGAREFASYFLAFRGFTAIAPESVGDYAELKPFRDLVGTHLSPAPRSPDPLPPAQAELNGIKVAWLEWIGRQTGRIFAWAGPLLLVVGLIRLVEATLDRRPTFRLGLAVALLGACAGYLLINVLVHVTSFFNLSPAAMAAAYPLYLLGLGAILADAAAAWAHPSAPPRSATGALPGTRLRWLVPAGTALLVFAARLREIHLHAGDVPYNDQWIIEARDLILPWLDGTLRPWHFFAPQFEHVPAWTRLLAWIQVAVTGRWDPLLQMTVNAALHTAFVWFVARWVWATLSSRAAGFVSFVLLLGGALPYAWENIAWGFQSQFPLALLALFVHMQGSLTRPVGSRAWWWAQAAGAAGLFTLAGMWAAPLAVVASLLWTGARDRRALAVPALIAGAGLAMFFLIRLRAGPVAPAAAVRNVLDFLHAILFQLGWPSTLAGAAAIVQLPWLVHALRLRGRSDATPVDRIILTLGLWSAAHALGLALARGGGTEDHVSRYGDLLFIGTLAGGLALTRLAPRPGRVRWPFMAGAAAWLAVVASGLLHNATEGHARYFHQTAAQHNALRREAIQAYVLRGDLAPLEREETRWVLSQSTDVVRRLLDRADFRALLPASVNPAAGDHAAGTAARGLQARWDWLLWLGAGGLMAGLVLAYWREAADPLPPLPELLDRWPERIALAAGLGCTAGLFLWSNPLVFDREYRWGQLLGGSQALTGVKFEFASPAEFGPERLQGAAPLGPVELRNRFYGTAPAGPAWTGTVVSTPFPLTKSWLVVPIAGYPTGHGNGLRLRVLDERGGMLGEEIGCPGPNQDGVAYWAVDVSAHVGRRARLVLYDGRGDTQAWVAVAPPVPADSPAFAEQLAERLARETHGRLHAALAMLAATSYLCAFVLWRSRRLPTAQK
jgi:hypothetical protein